MTVHQAKGLEFGIVFVADCGAKEREPWSPVTYDPSLGVGMLLPGSTLGKLRADHRVTPRVAALRTERQRAESLRLFYVAATRAKDRVVFSGDAISGGTWRDAIDSVLADPETAPLLPRDRSRRSVEPRAAARQRGATRHRHRADPARADDRARGEDPR